MKSTVIICTYNRCSLLDNVIGSLTAQSFPHDNFEILVVDNNSSDQTEAVVKETAVLSDVRISYICEQKQGLSHARNAGIARARGEVVLFIDDDAVADTDWVANMVAAFDDPEVAAAGGPVVPLWEVPRPGWLPDKWVPYLSADDFADLLGTSNFTLQRAPVGTNMAFRKKSLGIAIRFPTSLGRTGTNLVSNEEVVVCRELMARGSVVRFVPEAIVRHLVAPTRLKKQWFYKRVYWQGRSDLLLAPVVGLAVPFSFVIWSLTVIKNVLAAPFFSERSRFSALMMVYLHWGKLVGLLHQIFSEETPV